MAIGDAGQLSRVAHLLHVTQSALFKALAEIERSIGEPPFERTGAGLVPNRRGATLIRAARAARAALAELERAGDELERQARAQDRTLAVGAVPLYGDPLVIVAEPGHPLAPLLPLRLADLTAARIEAWLQGEAAQRPAQARLAFGALRAFLHWCERPANYSGLADPQACSRDVAREALPNKRAKSDCLQREQLKPWFAAVRSLKNAPMAAYLQILLLTGSRREELAHLTWADVDAKWKTLTIRDKVEGTRVIPLTPYVAQLIAALPRRPGNRWVFSSVTSETGRLREPRIPHNRALLNAEIDGLTLHGLRRSFATLSEWVEVPVGIVAQIMGHKPSATAEKHYKQRPIDLLRLWHTRIEAWVLEQARVELVPAPSNVVPLREKAIA